MIILSSNSSKAVLFLASATPTSPALNHSLPTRLHTPADPSYSTYIILTLNHYISELFPLLLREFSSTSNPNTFYFSPELSLYDRYFSHLLSSLTFNSVLIPSILLALLHPANTFSLLTRTVTFNNLLNICFGNNTQSIYSLSSTCPSTILTHAHVLELDRMSKFAHTRIRM